MAENAFQEHLASVGTVAEDLSLSSINLNVACGGLKKAWDTQKDDIAFLKQSIKKIKEDNGIMKMETGRWKTENQTMKGRWISR